MKGVILLNGEPYKGEIDDTNALVFCADGAYNWAKGRVRIDENLAISTPRQKFLSPAPQKFSPPKKMRRTGKSRWKKCSLSPRKRG